MSDGKINERILEGIRENSKGNKVIEEFLVDLIMEETDHTGNWWWKEPYMDRVNKYSKKWEEIDREN